MPYVLARMRFGTAPSLFVLPFATLRHKGTPQSWDMTVLSPPTEVKITHSSCGLLLYVLIEVEYINHLDEHWHIYAIHPPVRPCLPLSTQYHCSVPPAMATIRSQFLTLER